MLVDLLTEDLEGEKLNLFQDFELFLDDYKDEFGESYAAFEEDMLRISEHKQEEIQKFESMYNAGIEAVDQQSKSLVADFKLLKKRTKAKLSSSEFQMRSVEIQLKEKKELVKELRDRSSGLRESLLALEMFQIEQYEDLIGQFEEKFGVLRSRTQDYIREFLEKFRAIQNTYFEKVREKAGELLAKFQAGELNSHSLTDDAKQVLGDKDAFMTGVVNGSHEFRLAKIDAKDEELNKNENMNFTTTVDSTYEREKDRSRTRTDDVRTMLVFFEKEIDEITARTD